MQAPRKGRDTLVTEAAESEAGGVTGEGAEQPGAHTPASFIPCGMECA